MRFSKWAAVAAVALVATTGCSVHPGAAAVVDGRTITQEYTQEASEDLGLDAGRTLSLLIDAPYYVEMAENNGVGVSPDDVRTAVHDGLLGEGTDPNVQLGDGATEIVQLVLADKAVNALPDGARIRADTNARISGLDMDINPRYGERDPASGLIALPPLPWIVPTNA